MAHPDPARRSTRPPRHPSPKKPPRGPQLPRQGLTVAWAGLVLVLLTILFFNPVVIGGKTFVSPDAVAPAGFVRMGEEALAQERLAGAIEGALGRCRPSLFDRCTSGPVLTSIR